jgi:long-chain acyl-CoA synthetase
MRPHLASLVDDMRRNDAQTAFVWFRGVRRHSATYAEVARLAGRFAAELNHRDIGPGERVVLWGENAAAWVGAFFGCLRRGVLVVPLDVAGSPAFAERVLNDVQPRLVLADAARWSSLPDNAQTTWQHIPLEQLDDLLPHDPSFAVAPEVTLDSPFQIVFTSGTTAEPKGIVHTHRNVLASVEPIEREMAKYRRYERIVHPLRMLHTLPLSHVFGQFMGLWMAPLLAMEVHLEPRIEAGRMLRRIKSEKIDTLVAVPRTLELLRARLLADDPALATELAAAIGISPQARWWRFRRIHRRLGLRFWALICGGAALPPDLELFWGRLGLAVIQGYGMTETAALITLNHPFHVGRGTLGKPLPGREVKLSDTGEILVRGATISTATWRNGKLEQREGEWLPTGDLATQDDTGALRFAGRQSETIVTAAGLNIYPADLEAALLRQPGVRSAAVVACAGSLGPEAVAVLVCADDNTPRRAVEAANAELAEFQRMRRALRWNQPSLPYTATGKLMRRHIAAWACAQLAAQAAGGADRGEDPLLALLVEVTGSRSQNLAGADTDALRLSEDLALDSLARVQLQAVLEERFGLGLDETTMARATTLGDLRRLIEPHPASPNAPDPSFRSNSHPVADNAAGGLALKGTSFSSYIDPAAGHAALAAEGDSPGGTAHLVHRYPRWTWSPGINALRLLFQEAISRPLVRLLAAPKVIPATRPAERPLLIVANHITSYDVPLVLYALPWPLRRRIAVAMAGEMLLDYRRGRGTVTAWLNPLMPLAYWLITVLFNVFPLPRLGGFRQSFEHAGAALDAGYSVLIFPEGRRSADGTLQPFRSGIGLRVQQADADVLPVALVGLGAARQTGRWFRAGIQVRVGEALRFAPDQPAEAITADLEQAVASLLHAKRN